MGSLIYFGVSLVLDLISVNKLGFGSSVKRVRVYPTNLLTIDLAGGAAIYLSIDRA